jgi:hypothetical protein
MIVLLAATGALAQTKKPVTKRLCEEIFDNHPGVDGTLGHVPFGEIWNKFLGPDVFCPELGSREKAIKEVTVEGCDINWREGKFYKHDDVFTKAGGHKTKALGPAVLGFDGDLDAFCKAESPEGLENGHADASCGKHNRLYLKQWTLCKNMKWILCAGMGFLPGQNGVGEIIMVTPINKMDGGRMSKPEDVPEGTPELTDEERKDYEHEMHRVPEAFGVTVHEVCTLNKMCSNGDQVFDVATDEENKPGVFVCANPTIPIMLLNARAQDLPDTAEDEDTRLPTDGMPKFARSRSSGLRGGKSDEVMMDTLVRVDKILDKELDLLGGGGG